MTYRYGPGARRSSRSDLTPPSELVGQRVSWRPKGPDGKRHAAVNGRVRSFDAETRELVIRVPRTVSMWQPEPHSDERVPLSHGPFTPA